MQSLTQKWLRQNILQYSQQDRVFADIDAALARFPNLRPKSDIYTYDDGRTQLLICIHGLLPISYRQASYNIPIAVWLTREYPRQPPIAYVVPTSDMLVKAGKYIDVSGRCDIDYVTQWARKSEGCNISALLEAMQDHFSREPPLYAKPRIANAAPTSPPPQQAHAQGSSHSSVANHPTSPPRALDGAPKLPPKPGSFDPGVRDLRSVDQNVSGPSSLPLQTSIPLAARPPPPLPSHHTASDFVGPPQYTSHHNSVPPNYPPAHRPVSVNHSGSYGWSPGGPAPQQPPHDPRWSAPPPPPPQSIAQSPPPLQAPIQTTDVMNHPPIPNLLDEEPSASQFPEILASTSRAPAPPRPPNPELMHLHAQVHHKLTTELASLAQALALDADRLRAQQKDLLTGEPAIQDEMARLEAVRDVCRNVAGRVRQSVNRAEENVTELRRKGDPEVDELVCSTTIVHNQLVNLVAEDNAIEDTIYHLHRALSTGRIDLERFLRTTRVLAEEQFMKRALIEKIQTGLPMGSQWS